MSSHKTTLVSLLLFITVATGLYALDALESRLVVLGLALSYLLGNLIYWSYKHELSWSKAAEYALLAFIGYYALVYLI